MLVAERHALLLDRLARDGRVVARALAPELGLSEDTVRRDLRELACRRTVPARLRRRCRLVAGRRRLHDPARRSPPRAKTASVHALRGWSNPG